MKSKNLHMQYMYHTYDSVMVNVQVGYSIQLEHHDSKTIIILCFCIPRSQNKMGMSIDIHNFFVKRHVTL